MEIVSTFTILVIFFIITITIIAKFVKYELNICTIIFKAFYTFRSARVEPSRLSANDLSHDDDGALLSGHSHDDEDGDDDDDFESDDYGHAAEGDGTIWPA